MQEWLPLPGFPQYQVSNFGEARYGWGEVVRPIKLVRRTTGRTQRGVYYSFNVSFRRNIGKRHFFRIPIHGIVAELFIGPRPNNYVIMHLDGDPANNRVDNLKYVTKSVLIQETIRRGSRVLTRGTAGRFK